MKPIQKFISALLSVTLLMLSLNSANAALIGNAQVIQHAQLDSARTTLLQTLNRAEVKEQLVSLGVQPESVEARVNMMTQEELAQLNQQIDALPAGGHVLGILLIVFIVFVITDVIGATDIFPFIHPVR